MRIESVSARVLAARPARGVVFALGAYDVFTLVLVEVRSEEGLVGYGEAIARRGAAATCETVESLLAPVLVGRDARDIGGLWVEMVDRLRRWGHVGGIVIEALSGVDCALWDLAGKASGEPVWRLLHGAGRLRLPVYASSVYIDSDAAMVEQAVEQVSSGFSAVKIKIGRDQGTGGPRGDVRAVEAIRAAVGPDVELMVDANGAFDAPTAVRVGRALAELDVKWFEEPVPPDDEGGYRRVHAAIGVPLAAGEGHFGPFGFRSLVVDGLVDYVQPDLGRCGGITAAMQVAAMAYAYNRRVAPHTGFSGGLSQLAALHVAAATPVLDSLEYMFIDNPARELFVGGYPRPQEGSIAVPDGPGLGLELDLELVARLETRAKEELS